MDALLNIIFMALWSVFGSDPSVPSLAGGEWNGPAEWRIENGYFHYAAVSERIPELCREKPSAFVDFPMIINGWHEIHADGKLLKRMSDPDFQEVRSIYGKPYIPCKELVEAKSLEWRTATDSKYFARFTNFPALEARRPLDNFFNEILNIVAAGTLLIMGMFCMIIFFGKVSPTLAVSYFSANVFLSLYFIGTVPGLLSLKVDILNVHHWGDSSMWIGTCLLYYVLYSLDVINKLFFRFFATVTVCTVALQWLGRTGDEVQMGTTLGFLPAFIVFFHAIFRLIRSKLKGRIGTKLSLLQLISLSSFAFAGMNDMLVVMGVFDGYLFYSCGLISQVMFLALAVHETILDTYRERDYLRSNLEKEVERKTAELRATQAELIQSAKLASLGTLSAGIAHEINNSINFVNGAISPLEKIIGKLQSVSAKDYELGQRLLSSIKDGTRITVEIVKSLRQFTGLNQAKLKDVSIVEVVRGVTTILHSKLKENYEIVTDIPEDLTMYADVVGINQILMNLITNAIDAMPGGGKITVRAWGDSEGTVIEVKDTGSGIPKEIVSKIFDPFFTTKDVGSGTGLGLYIVNKEMERYKGRVSVESESGSGTTFQLCFPRPVVQLEGVA